MPKSGADASVFPDSTFFASDYNDSRTIVQARPQRPRDPRGAVRRGEASDGPATKLIAKLERMTEASIPAEWYVDLLRAYKPLLRKINSYLPRPTDAGSAGLTPEQRLNDLLMRNVALALEVVDKAPDAFSPEGSNRRRWLIKTLFSLVGAQVDYAVRWSLPWVPQMWRTLHNHYDYLQRRESNLGEQFVVAEEDGEVSFDPHYQYKRLVLHGLVQDMLDVDTRALLAHGEVPRWARETRLRDVGGYAGVFGLFVVDITKDIPAFLLTGSMEAGFHGRILMPPDTLVDTLSGPPILSQACGNR